MAEQNRPYQIVTDSSCDLPKAVIEELGLRVVQLDVMFEGENARPNDQVDVKEFYTRMRAGDNVKTAAVNMDAFLSCFRPILEEGKDLLYLGFSSGLSSTYSSAATAAAELAEAFPEAKIRTVDTLCASLGQGLLVYHAALRRQLGESIDQVAEFAEQNKWRLCHWFTVDDLMFLKRGGRVSAVTAVVGSMLSIKPILHVDNEGHLIAVGKVRGRKTSIEELFHRMEQSVVNPEGQPIFISHGDCLEEAQRLAGLIQSKWKVGRIIISEVGPVIGAHSGPGTMALFFLGRER